MSVHGPAMIAGVCLACLCSAASIAFADGAKPTTAPAAAAGPGPQLSPSDVVRAVMTALQKNDAADSGIRTTFKFASPANQQMTGPIERFIPLVKNPAYAALLNHRRADVREVGVKGDQAVEMVTVQDAAGNIVHYVFELSKQHDAGPLKDCWMTDGVMPVQPAADDGHTA